MNEWVLLVVGLVGLLVGAEFLVRGGSAIAARMGISPLLVGLTVVSIGTSLPELAVGIDASLNDAGPLAVGNIAGTNIVNILLILGLSALMAPIALSRQTVRFDLPIMVGSAALLLVLCLGGTLSRVDGALLVVVAVAYTVLAVRFELRAKQELFTDPVLAHEMTEARSLPTDARPIWFHAASLLGGIVLIVLAADWLVHGSVDIARDLGVSEAVIGLTIVAIGTSAPELVATIMSTLRGNRDLAIGNLIGSSVYNITFILGATSLVKPVEVTDELITIDIPIMLAVAALCIPVFVSGRRVTRWEGGTFVAVYLVYLVALLALRT